MTIVEPAARAETVTVACAGLPAASRSDGSVAPVVDRVGHQVPKRIGDTVENPGVELDVLADQTKLHVLVGGASHLTDQLGERCDHSPGRHHRQPHGPVSHLGKSVLRVLHRAAHLAHGRLELVPQRHEPVQALGDLRRNAHVSRRRLTDGANDAHMLGGESGQLEDSSLDTTRLQLGLADHVQQTVDAAHRDADGLAGLAAARLIGVDLFLCGGQARARSPGSGPPDASSRAAIQPGEVVVGHRTRRTGKPAANSLSGSEQQVDQVTPWVEPAVA